jgi:hypothetical protein
MPKSKHRRNGKIRTRRNLKNRPPLPQLPPVDYEWERHKDALLIIQLRKMYGGNDWDDWTEYQIDAAIEEMDRAQRQDPVLAARLRIVYGGNEWGDWTDGEIDAALNEMWRESGQPPLDYFEKDQLMLDPASETFEQAQAELRVLGIALTRLTGKYRVNFRDHTEATARIAETLDDAIVQGWAMSAELAATAPRGCLSRRDRRQNLHAAHDRLASRKILAHDSPP